MSWNGPPVVFLTMTCRFCTQEFTRREPPGFRVANVCPSCHRAGMNMSLAEIDDAGRRQYPLTYDWRVEAVDLITEGERDRDLASEPPWLDRPPSLWQGVVTILFIAGLLAWLGWASWWALVQFLVTVEEEQRFGRGLEVPYTYRDQ